METSPTDKRIDDLSDRVGRFEDKVEGRFERFEANVARRFERFEDKVDRRFGRFEDKVDRRFDEVKVDAKERSAKSEAAIGAVAEKFDKLNRRLTGGLITIVGAVILKVFIG
jgi:hypothetical protein